jgi:branched-chain amino acid transport system substrate-binding protein
MKQAAETAKSADALAMAMHPGMTFKAVAGDLSFDKKGDVTHAAYVVYVWRKGPDGRTGYDELDK